MPVLDRPADEPGPLPPPRHAPPRRPRGRLTAIGVVAVAVAVAIAARDRPLTFPWDAAGAPPTAALTATPDAPTQPPPSTTTAPTTPNDQSAQAEIDRLLAAEPGVCGVVMMSQ
jgi:hypothetical protein